MACFGVVIALDSHCYNGFEEGDARIWMELVENRYQRRTYVIGDNLIPSSLKKQSII